MSSNAMQELETALSDVDALLTQAASFADGKRGAPKSVDGTSRPGRPFTRAASVMLAGAAEAYLEKLGAETGDHLPLTDQQKKDLKAAVKAMHGIGSDKVHGLYAMIGCPFILDECGWQGLKKGTARSRLSELHTARNKIAHGNAPKNARISHVKRDQSFVISLAKALEKITAARISTVTGQDFDW